ncbi:dTDP-4-dehydrorhamnose 3,5-epimerase family protein [Bradyrhizobium diazoefficiens]|uniref:dTDP-4-dehydrorhamnose 3,5-epimerase family protein n=1 Tax=Bradyrhizobium diazoefficiens TaxID=1355477 RepID=UPI00272A9FD3|nr:dTDP-4-dehydrorhamnose 3,5-epimerase family protein [Bradyrhizobium diazoefficiens]WLA68042.1 dTDP-4-dehydrorhamnose 3,5-epimerase family protein [Bradyrhizobium diazoefficiens]
MRFEATPVSGVFLISADPIQDDRGFFARIFDPDMFAAKGIHFNPWQISLSHNRSKATLRGMHYSRAPESKLVHCTRGKIYDVALDLRRGSSTFGAWFGLELNPLDGTGLFIPPGVAHGYLTIEPDSDVLYHTNCSFDPAAAAGARWNDQAFGIVWPMTPAVINARDAGYPDFEISSS